MKITRFFIKLGIIIGIITALCYGLLSKINKSNTKREVRIAQNQRAQAKLAKSLRAKNYTLTRGGGSLIFKVSKNRNISWQMPEGQSCKFRTLMPGSMLPRVVPGKTDSQGWMLCPPHKHYTKWDLPRFDKVAAYEFAWWVPPRARYYVPSRMTLSVGFSL